MLLLQIVFNNKATQPYSIYPHGLTIDKAGEGANYPQGGKAPLNSEFTSHCCGSTHPCVNLLRNMDTVIFVEFVWHPTLYL